MQDDISKTTPNSEATLYGRRDFLTLLGGGIIVFFPAVLETPAAQGPPKMGPGAATDFNAYLRIGEDGEVTVFSGKVELGQSNTTALAQMAAEELGVALESIRMIMGDTDLCPWDMGTFGSMSIRVYGAALRSAAAEAKAVLLQLASEQLGMPPSDLIAENGVIRVRSDKNRKLSYAQLAKGQRIIRKLEQKAGIKQPADFAVIGQSPARLDGKAKVTGAALFTGDLRFPGLLYARILRPPAHGASLKSVDTSSAEQMPGVVVVKEEGLIAVLHEDPETAEKALASVKAAFDEPSSPVDPETIFDHILQAAPKPQTQERKGDLAEGEKASAAIFEAKYLNGYGAHASIETHTACARLEGEKMTVWISTQTPFPNQQEIARALKLAPQNVRVITPFVGGGFGGKSAALQALDAARLAKATGKPVQVSYSRAEEFFYDHFRPAAIVRIKSGLDGAGKICLWDYHVYYAGSRSAEQFYDVPNNLMSTYGGWMGDTNKAHPFYIGAWRAPGSNINVFARESHIDTMAAHAKADPLEFRLRNTSDARMRRVLQTAAERFGYKASPGPSGRGYGIACAIDAGAYVAEIAEVKMDSGKVKVQRIVAVQDMGVVINPEGARMQMEGCIMMGLGYSLSEDIDFKGGRIFTSNFHNYSIPRFSWLPDIDAFLIRNDQLTAQGGGEPAIAPVGGAIANAIFDLAGVRLFQMPMTPERINKAQKLIRD